MAFSFMSMDSVKGDSENESERKFWGTETSTITNCNDDCCTTTTYETYYVFWMSTGTEITGFDVYCW